MSHEGPSDRAKGLDGYVPFPDERAGEYVEEGYWRNLRFHDVLDEAAAERPEATAVVDPYREVTYDELAANSRRLAAFLSEELDLEPLDRVGFQLPNRAEFVEAFFACSRVGAVPVMLLPRHRRAEVEHVLETTDAKVYLTLASDEGFDFVELGDAVADILPSLDHRIAVGDGRSVPDGWHAFDDVTSDAGYDEYRDEVAAIDVNPCDPGVFLLSGGTTGMPKAIPRTHNDYVFQWEHMAKAVGVEADWTGFASVPLAHNASLVCVAGPSIWRGATLALEPELKPEPLMDLIERTDGSFSLPIPTQLIDVLEHPNRDEYDLTSLKVLISGGQKVPPRVVYDSVEAWDVDFCNIFGMAEGPIIVTRPEQDVDVQARTVGYPLHPEADDVRLVDQADRSTEVPWGEKGELSVRGPGCFTGYFRNPEENRENFADGRFFTEDVMRQREDGNYEVHGRLKDMIIRGGENIYTPGVEDAVLEHPTLEQVSIVGKPDERLGERPYAFVKLIEGADDLTVEELSDWLDERGVAIYKHPEFVEVVKSFPRTEVEKIDKQTLRERVGRD